MNALELLRSLPSDLLPASANVDFLHFIGCAKPLVRTNVHSTYASERVTAWCHAHDLGVEADRDGFICVAWSQRLATQALQLDRCELPHTGEFGQLLGYPSCCCEFIAHVGEAGLDSAEAEIAKWQFFGDFALINPVNYLEGHSLICHLPCSAHCIPSLRLAQQALAFIRANWHTGLFARWSEWLSGDAGTASGVG